MQHTIPFDSSLKTDPPPHPGEDYSSKRAKLDAADNMDSSELLDSVPNETHCSAMPLQDFVLETLVSALPVVNPSKQDVHMSDGLADSGPKIPSFKDKLLNSDSTSLEEDDDDLVLHQGDVVIGLNSNVPMVDFASHVLETLNHKMGIAVVVKLMGNGVDQAPQIDGKVLSQEYHQVNGEIIFVEYEGLPKIFFDCGRYGHRQKSCPEKMDSTSVIPLADQPTSGREVPLPKATVQERDFVNYGEWMLVQRRPRRTTEKDEERQEVHVQENEIPFQKNMGTYHKKKSKVTNGTPRVAIDIYQKVSGPLTLNQEFAAQPATTSLDKEHNTTILINDSRLPQRSSVVRVKPTGPPHKPNPGKDPISTSRGLKLASGVSLHNMEAKSNSDAAGPSVRLMKEVARGLQSELGKSVYAMNCQGAFDTKFPSIFKSLVFNYKPDIFVILEPRIFGTKANKVIKKLGFQFSHRVEATGFSGGIWILWSPRVSIKVLVNQVQFVHMEVTCVNQNSTFIFTAIYGNPQQQYRKFLWQDLDLLADNISSPWLLVGDFNAILSSDDRRGGAIHKERGCNFFNEFIHSNGLMDMGSKGPKFTWCRGTLLMRIDRAICNTLWTQEFHQYEINHLPKLISDHRPVLISLGSYLTSGPSPRPFCFLAPWISHPDFPLLVEYSWKEESDLLTYINNFTASAQRWNADTFGAMGKRKRRLLNRIRGIQIKLEDPVFGSSDFLTDLEVSLKEEFEEMKALMRRKKNSIKQLKNHDGVSISDEKHLADHAEQFFKALYSLDEATFFPLSIQGRFLHLSDAQLLALEKGMSLDEIK
ncbi:hypothetical protein K1719_000200 [Acacia pycnantha]|nr:hypothetical protein K1719_000200 [Acacia pycnantha]